MTKAHQSTWPVGLDAESGSLQAILEGQPVPVGSSIELFFPGAGWVEHLVEGIQSLSFDSQQVQVRISFLVDDRQLSSVVPPNWPARWPKKVA